MTDKAPERNDMKALADHCRVYAAGLRKQNELAVGPNMSALALDEAAAALEAAQARIAELEASYDDQKWKRYAAEMELAHTASARAEALEEAARVLDQHESVPCKPAFPEVWSDEAINRYESGQIDAAISWQAAIRALKGGSNE